MYVCYYTVAPYNVTITVGGINVSASPFTVEYNESLTLNCAHSGGPGNMVHWLKDNSFQGTTDNTLMINAVTADDGGIYQCVVNNTAGESSTEITIYGMCVIYCLIHYI